MAPLVCIFTRSAPRHLGRAIDHMDAFDQAGKVRRKLILWVAIPVGIIVIISISIKREERDSQRTSRVSLTRRTPTQAASGARYLTSLRTGRPPTNPSHGIPFPYS